MGHRKKSTCLTNTGVGSDQQPFVRHHPHTHKTGHGQPASRAAASQSADWHNPPDGTSLGAWRSAFLEPAGWVNGCTNFLFEISKQTITDTITTITIDYNHIPWRWQRYKWACRLGGAGTPMFSSFRVQLMKDNRDLETLTLYNNELVGNIPSAISPKMSRIYLQVRTCALQYSTDTQMHSLIY